MFRYVLSAEGVKIKLVEFYEKPGETAEMMFNMLRDTFMKWNVEIKIVRFCADNAPTDFGTVERRGNKKVFSCIKYFPACTKMHIYSESDVWHISEIIQ